ncbi:DUF4386 domain-containing protein [Nitrospirillum sp. BR 11163]|uniref:DUF4386 domain-containing protein n=1 Tax=Nitrospirillum sp. BR 11163 TaxID=3104323 RepID=UPI002AFF4767|nr:DUF4386 domain-containing protein [Nitrospirillum sp. BR 11163]MEA1673865.1 DUF4386 domain-containing protein [Nitrospirillum sp. BR 11163]
MDSIFAMRSYSRVTVHEPQSLTTQRAGRSSSRLCDDIGGLPVGNQFGIKAPRAWARFAGICWLATIGAGYFAEGVVRKNLIEFGDAVATLHNIFAHEAMYRLAVAAEFGGTATYLVLTAILYLLLAPVNRVVSLMAAVFSVAGCTIWFLNLINNSAPLILLGGAHPPVGADLATTQALAFALIRLGNEILLAGMLCFGVHCLLLGGLIVRSSFFPKWIGLVLAVGGVGYLVSGFAHVAAPDIASAIGKYGYMPGQAGELLMGVFLTLLGVNASKWNEAASRNGSSS